MNFLSISKKKITITKNEKIDLLLLDDNFSNLKFTNLKCGKIEKNKIYLRYLTLALIKYLFTTTKRKKLIEYYFIELIKSFDPKVAVGHDMNGRIFMFNKLFPKRTSIAYQYGYIFKNDIGFWKKVLQKKSANYYAVFDQRSANILKKYVKAKFIITGSIKSNEYKLIDKNKKKKYDLMYISAFRSLNDYPHQVEQNKRDAIVVKTLSEFCKKNKKNFVIALSSSREDKKIRIGKAGVSFRDEVKFYKKYATNFHLNRNNSLDIAKFSNLCVCTNSNLGHELLSIGKKIFFYTDKREKYRFFHGKNGPFWHHGHNKLEIEKKLKKLINMNYKAWHQIKLKNFKENVYDFKNKKLKKLAEDIINKGKKHEQIYS